MMKYIIAKFNIVLFLQTILFVICCSGCIKEANLTYRATKPLLVVDGLLLTDSTPCRVVLTNSGIFNNRGSQAPDYINDARVYVKKDGGDSIALVSRGDGVYTSAEGIGAKPGDTFTLYITLSNGKRYASAPEKIIEGPKDFGLDTIGQSNPFNINDLKGANVYVHTKDIAGQKNYYRWVSVDWLPRKSLGVPCGINLPNCFQYCYQNYYDRNVYIASDENIDGSTLTYQTALISPYYYFGSHYISIQQLSLTESAYQFWKLYQQQTTLSGGILDPVPSPIQGNIYSMDDSTEMALGYFGASDVVSLKCILSPVFINQYLTFAHITNYISDGACYQVYPGAMTDAPAGWATAQQYIYNVY